MRNHSSKLTLKRRDTFACFCRSSTVNWTPLRCIGDGLSIVRVSFTLFSATYSVLCQEYHAVSDGRFATAKRVIPEILDSIETKLLCKFFRKCWRYMDAYELEF